MRMARMIYLSLVLIVSLLLVGCTKENDPTKEPTQEMTTTAPTTSENKQATNTSNDDPEDPDDEKQWRDIPFKMNYYYNTFIFEGIKHIGSYEEYLSFSELSKVKSYDPSFFETSRLIVYSTIERSGSNRVFIKGIGLNEDEKVIVSVHKFFPPSGSKDIAPHGYVFEYDKQETKITDVVVDVTVLQEEDKVFLVHYETKTPMIEFIDNHSITSTLVTFRLLERDDQIRVKGYEAFNREQANTLEMNKLPGELHVSTTSPIIHLAVESFTYEDIENLVTISKNERVEEVKTMFVYLTERDLKKNNNY